MPRGQRGAVLAPPDLTDPLMADSLAPSGALTYSEMLREAGAYFDANRGGVVHRMPIGQPYRRGGRWLQSTKVYPVANSAEEARNKTRDTGERHDWYCPGKPCKRCAEAGADPVMSGWVLGGRKFQQEHGHVTDFDPTLYGEIEVAAPDMEDEDDPVMDGSAVPVEA